MKYDFTTGIDRHDMDALAVDYPPGKPKDGFDLIPMWVADMNFATAPSIPEAIIERTKHALYGYFIPRDEYYDAIINWHKDRNGVEGLERKHIGYANGVLGGVVSALNVLCSKGDNVLIHSPTYVGFTHALGDNGYNGFISKIVTSVLVIIVNYFFSKFLIFRKKPATEDAAESADAPSEE